jgi:eukaryotic-like serine/threonine-protein kinase
MPSDPAADAETLPDTSSRPLGSESREPPNVGARYALESVIGRGGMGEIWLARDLRVDREIAIKVLRGDGPHDPGALARFLREARVQARLEHPSVVPVHDLAASDAAPFFAMKRLTGTTLADVLTAQRAGDREMRERWPRRILLARLVDVCLAIELAHQRGVIHRDIKPANVMLGDFGEAYVIDWGLAKLTGEVDDPVLANPATAGEHPGDHTVAGSLLGTPGYMAPEQVRGEPVDPRADVFSLGCVLYEIIAGEPAISRDRAFEDTLEAARHRPSERDRDAEIAPELDDACARATAADRERRYPSARALADAIQSYLDGDHDRERRRELAESHTARARAAWQAGGDRARGEVMRETGRALALDSDNRDAQELLLRLLLEPPREIPQAARAEIDRDRNPVMRAVLHKVAWTYGAFLVLTIGIELAAATATWPHLLIASLLAALTGICTWGARQTGTHGDRARLLVLGLHVLLLGATAIVVGSLFVLPAVVIGSLATFVASPAMPMPRLVGVLHVLAPAIPLGLELAGVLPPTFHLVDGGVLYRPWAIDLEPMALVGLIGGVTVLQAIVTTAVMAGQRAILEQAHERIHVQRWHFQQLLGTSTCSLGAPSD